MKLVNAIAAGLLLISAKVVFCDFAEHSFIDENTGRILSITQGTASDFQWAKDFCLQFFKPSYEKISLDADQQAYGSFEAFIDAKFADHQSNIFAYGKYIFFTVKDGNENIGYTIFDAAKDRVYSIETQADIKTYSVNSLMNGLAYFIKSQVAPNADYFISAVRKTTPQFVGVLKTCNFVEYENGQLHPTLSSEYYLALTRKL
jgi:hypothetical protein